MVPDIENAIYAQFDGQKLPLGTAIFKFRSPGDARMVEKRRFESKNNWHENCYSIMVSNGLNQ
jgi:hypothetical protein